MTTTKTPLRLWDMCAKYAAELHCITAQPLYSLHGQTPFKLVTGNTPDISEYLACEWFQPVWYYDTSSFLNATHHIGRWIGVAHIIGQAMCFWILPESGIPIARSTVQAISDDELRSVSVQHQLNENEDAIEIDQETTIKELSEADNDGHDIPCEPEAQKPEIEDYDEETYSKYTSAKVEGTINLLRRV